jgi:sigma-E factor negative regulatory protein RseC
MQNVVGVVRECEKGRVWIEVEQSGCGRCSEPGGCGGVSIGQSLCSRRKRFCLTDTLGLEPGDGVVVGVPDNVLLRSATAVYLVPLALGLVAAGVAHFLSGNSDSSLVDFAGFMGGLSAGWWFLTRMKLSVAAQPVLVARN